MALPSAISAPRFSVKTKKAFSAFFYTIIVINVCWLILTLLVEAKGPTKKWNYGKPESTEQVLIVFDPDPFYDLDQKVCLSLGEELAKHGMHTQVASVAAAQAFNMNSFDVLVFCSNTYNWEPDWALRGFIEDQSTLDNKPVIAITLGAGATKNSQKKLENLITRKQGKIVDSRALWLMRPNNESMQDNTNVQTAILMVRAWADFLAEEIKKSK